MEALKGCNVAILTYGAAHSGKHYTMFGGNRHGPSPGSFLPLLPYAFSFDVLRPFLLLSFPIFLFFRLSLFLLNNQHLTPTL
jgi:hypothetical protein